MAFRIPGIRRATSFSASKGTNVPKGYLAVYVGDKMKRFVIPVSYLNQPSFQELLCQAEEEFGYDHPTGGLTIPCSEDEFQNLTSELSGQTSRFLVLKVEEEALPFFLLWKQTQVGGEGKSLNKVPSVTNMKRKRHFLVIEKGCTGFENNLMPA
ncbi:hypothetical protein HN51_034427 [Arachis hypogaea]